MTRTLIEGTINNMCATYPSTAWQHLQQLINRIPGLLQTPFADISSF
jgi:hypothetical protein